MRQYVTLAAPLDKLDFYSAHIFRRGSDLPYVNPVVYVADDNASTREHLTHRLRADGMICRAFPDAETLIGQLDRDAAGCIVARVRDPQTDGPALAGALRDRGAAMLLILVSDRIDARAAVAAMKAGVCDLFETPVDDDGLAASVRACLETARADRARAVERAAVERRRRSLTQRERQILAEVAAGLSSKEVGLKLGISARTVEVHRANLMSKMHAGGVTDLVRMVALADAA
jgi:two-component system response regulator FixJ